MFNNYKYGRFIYYNNKNYTLGDIIQFVFSYDYDHLIS